MHSKILQFLIILLILYMKKSEAITTGKYVDLLDLTDNDEFLWSRQANGATTTTTDADNDDSNQTQNVTRHNLNKRQSVAVGGGELQPNLAYGACRTPGGEEGTCRHVIYCRIPDLKDDVWRLVSHLCIIQGSTIGICCPTRIVDRLGPQVIADGSSRDFEGPRIINRPEQRGCGVTTKQFPRVKGGRPAEPDEWPWMAAFIRPGLPYIWCGGALVTDRHVLTAAHCIYKIKTADLFVRLGEYNTLLLNETRARDFRIGNMVTHIDYDPLTFENDIGLVRVERPTIFNTYIWPVCMPPIGESWEGKMAIVTGWGSQKFGGPHADILMEVNLPIWKHEDCREAIVERVPDTMLCAGYPEGGQDSCQGDSGGPLLLQLPNRRWVTIGIVSWGIRCGEPNRPGMYTRVDRYLHWIIENSDI